MKLLSILLLAATLCAQTKSNPAGPAAQTPGATPKARASAVLPDDGILTGRTYTSSYFRFSYTVPEDLEVNADVMQGTVDAEQRSFVLLAAAKKPHQDSESGVKTGVMIVADRASDYAPLPDAGAYLEKVMQPVIKRDGFELLNPVREQTIAGKKFFRADYRKPGIYVSLVVTILRGYVVGFHLASPSEAELAPLLESLQTLKLSPLPVAPKAATPKPAK